MRKLMVARGAFAFVMGISATLVLSTSGLGIASAPAQEKAAAREAAPLNAAAANTAATKEQVAAYMRLCNAGERWNAAQTARAGTGDRLVRTRSKTKVQKQFA